jgi:hypothetical protein
LPWAEQRRNVVDDLSDKPRRVRGKPFAKGNSGRPKGSRNRTTVLLEQILEKDAVKIVQTTVALAKKKDRTALRLVFPQLFGAKKERSIQLDLVPVNSVAAGAVAMRQVVEYVAAGKISPSEGQAVLEMIEKLVQVFRQNDCEIEAVDPAAPARAEDDDDGGHEDA